MLRVQQICRFPAMSRAAHTRAKKVDVQLLKDNYGRRFKGEVFPVSEGHMRLKLHPEGIAAYVLKNQPMPLPVLSAQEAQKMRKEAQQLAKLAAAEAEVARQQDSGPDPADMQKQKVQTLIDALDFPTNKPQSATSETMTSSRTEQQSEQQSEQPAQSQPSQGEKKKFAWQNDFVVKMTEKK